MQEYSSHRRHYEKIAVRKIICPAAAATG